MPAVADRQTKRSRVLEKLAAGELRTLGREVASRAVERALTYTSDDGKTQTMPIQHERHFTNFGWFASPSTLGILGRAAPFPVVNVSRGGGVLADLIA